MTVCIDEREELGKIAKRLNLDDISQALHFPKYFQIETTRLCNGRCSFCAVDQWDKSHPFMTDELYDKIVEELAEYSDWVEFIAVQRNGEPLMDKKIVQRVRLLKEIGIKRVSLSTNASLLDEGKANQLLEAGLDEIMFSIDSINKTTYQKMRVGLPFETVVENIESFFSIREQAGSDCVVRVRGVSFFDMDNNEHQQELRIWEDFWSRFKRADDRIYMKKAHNWGNQKSWEGHTGKYDPVYHPCVLPWSTMHVTAMGTVPLCPVDYDAKMDIGDVNKESIRQIWKNENWGRIRRLHSRGDRNEIEFCRGCRLFDSDFSLENWQGESEE